MRHVARSMAGLAAAALFTLGIGVITTATPAAALTADSFDGSHLQVAPSVQLGRPGYSMGTSKAGAAPTRVAAAAVARDGHVSASYAHSPTPGSQPDLTAGSGPTMHSLTIYDVFWLPSGHYGTSSADDTTFENLMQRWAQDLSGSAYYNIVTQYYDASNSNAHITGSASFGGAFVDTSTAYPHAGTTADPLGDADIQTEVAHAVTTEGWTEDLNHMVVVFTANGIQECDSGGIADGHCTFPVSPDANGEFCAYHGHFSDGGNDALYGFLSYDDMFHGSGQTCVAGDTGGDTDPNRHVYPNGSRGADAEVSTMSHEVFETVTDPHPNDAWTTSGEIGDKCNFNYAPRNDSGADVYLNGNPYILQQEWSNAVHTCAIDLAGSSVVSPTVSFSKTVDNPTPFVTRSATYTVTLDNTNDTGAATNLAFADTMPAGYTVSGVTAPSASSLSNTSGSVSVGYDTLAVHQSRTIEITVTVPNQAGTVATNCASLDLQDLLGNPLSSLTTSPCASTTPQLIPATLTNAGSTSEDFNDPATVGATLTDDLANPIVGESVTLTLNGVESCTATTDGTGTATCTVTPGEAAGTYPLVASFAGTATYAATTLTTSFVVTLEETTTTYLAPSIIANGQPATLSGLLLEDGVAPISGRTLTLSLGTGGTQQTCSGVTDATGTASCTIASVAQPLGPGVAGADFTGDGFYLPSSGAGATLAFSYTAGGSFVVGDTSVGPIGAAVGKPVTFWGAKWSTVNILGGGAAPASFKGFENSSALPTVGTTWQARPGNSSPPPATVPLYTAMIVAGSITKSGSTISGNVLHLVIVKTNPGYGPNPSSTGTGTIAAVLS